MKNNYTKSLSSIVIQKVVMQSIIFTIILIFITFLCRTFFRSLSWSSNSRLYGLLNSIDHNITAFFLIIWLLGFLVILFFSWKSVIRSINKLVEESQKLVELNDEMIELPQELYEIQFRMNEVKTLSKKNALKARESEQKKNDLIVYLAHDIKTPLTSVIGYLSLLLEVKDMPKKQREKYQQIALDKAYQLEDLINELFDITRFNSEVMVLEKTALNLNLLLEQIAEEFYPIAHEMKKQVVIEIEDNIVIEADSDKFARAISNVLKNAISYSFEASKILIQVKKDTDVVISIINKGNKISDDKLNKIFDKFYRLDSSRSSNLGGAGLGLAITKEIIEMHDGTIEAQSTNEETTFIISLKNN